MRNSTFISVSYDCRRITINSIRPRHAVFIRPCVGKRLQGSSKHHHGHDNQPDLSIHLFVLCLSYVTGNAKRGYNAPHCAYPFRRLPVFRKNCALSAKPFLALAKSSRIYHIRAAETIALRNATSSGKLVAIKDIRKATAEITAAMQKIQPRRPSALSMAESMPFGERSPAHISVATFLSRHEPGGRAALQSAYSVSSAAIMRPMRSLICPIWFFVTPKRSATLSMGSSSSTYAR